MLLVKRCIAVYVHFFVQPQPFRFFLPLHIMYVRSVFVSLVLYFLYVCMCFPSLSPFHSDLDCPVVWGSSGLLLFSCSLRYLLYCRSPLSAHHFVFISLSLTPNLAALDLKQTYFSFLPFCADTLVHSCAHTYAFRDNLITVYMYLGTTYSRSMCTLNHKRSSGVN